MSDHSMMDETTIESGAYTSNLLGTIRSHLQGLQGFDTMALELIQNADDARAERIIFDVRDDGLRVWNSGVFRYCGSLKEPVCSFHSSEEGSCDFHRIADFGSGGKLSHSENIGRFGIGFSSTYQICDQPQIISSDIHLTLLPEEQRWKKREKQNTEGTIFFLPWATDPDSAGRAALGVSHVTEKHIAQLKLDFQEVLRNGLLFLRHLRRAELLHHGESILSVDLDRGESDELEAGELIVSFEPDGDPEQWLIVRSRADVTEVYKQYPQLKSLDRKRVVTVAIRLDPEPLDGGKLFAFLPTRQSSGLPLHLNADFFPEDSRKAIIFEGYQHQQAWNELLVRTAATALADDLLRLRDQLGYALLWQLLTAALQVKQDQKSTYPKILHSFWKSFQDSVEQGVEIGYSAQKSYSVPERLLFPSQPLSEQQQSAFHQIGGQLVSEELRSHRNTLIQLGCKPLTLEQFLLVVETSLSSVVSMGEPVSTAQLDANLVPLWEMVEALLPEIKAQPSLSVERSRELNRLKKLPLFLDSEERCASIESLVRSPVASETTNLTSHFPFFRFSHDAFLSFPKLDGLLDQLTIRRLSSSLYMCNHNSREELVASMGSGVGGLKGFYRLLAVVDGGGEADENAYGVLRELPIWKSGEKFMALEGLMLPGNFTDPTGQARLFDHTCLSQEATGFLEQRLGVKRQSIEEYVRTVVPRFFSGDGPQDIESYKQLILALADHAGLLNDDEICGLLSETPLIPSKDGGWCSASQLYYRTDSLVSILGENQSLWIDEQRLPLKRSVHSLIESLGILKEPSPAHLIDRILSIANASGPDTKAREASAVAFYELCKLFEKSTADALRKTINRMVSVQCLPAIGESSQWYMPEELFAPYRYQAFLSQAPVLDFKNTQRLNSDLLEALSISTSAETRMVVNHLLYCVEHQQPATTLVYSILDERAKKEGNELLPLKERPCIYLEAEKKYIRPNQLYLIPQELGNYSYTVPGKLDAYRNFFEAVGVKQKPEANDYIDIILEIVENDYPQQSQLSEVDRAVYQRCMGLLVEEFEMGDMVEEELERLRDAPSILNLEELFFYPEDLFLLDSDWHAKLYGDDLHPMLCGVDSQWWPLYQQLGLRLLSQSASVELDFVDGQEKVEEEIRDKMVERAGLFLRMLHEEPTNVRDRLSTVLQELSVVSHEVVRIVATVNPDNEPLKSAPSPVQAYCDESMEKVVVVRPVNDRTWLHLFTMLLHRLTPQASTSSISQLSMNLSNLVKMSVMDGDAYLTEANIPLLEESESSEEGLDLRSQVLGEIGGEVELSGDEAVVDHPSADVEAGSMADAGDRATDKKREAQTDDVVHGVKPPSEEQIKISSNSEPRASTGSAHAQGVGRRGRKSGPNRKSWDQKLRSYARQKVNGEGVGRTESEREHDLYVEVVTRGIVCDYERERGRTPEEMSQTHAGYDIVSRRQGSDEIERYIEVKGRNGEWSTTGVSVSRTQFSNAQDQGDKYWLYVVEYALDDSAVRVHAIQNPAMKVDSFMFDGGWRDVAVDEKADPLLRFVVGARVDCGALGMGIIEKVQSRGAVKSLVVDFGNGKKRPLSLNLKTMKVVDTEDGTDHP